MGTVYEWAPERSFPVDAQLVGTAVESLTKVEGACKPESLVQQARNASSPLHPLFEWRDGVAADRYRVDQARHAISSLRVVRIERVGGGSPQTPAFLSITTKATAEESESVDDGYLSIGEVRADSVLRQRAVEREWKQIKGWLRRTGWIEEFAPLRDAIPEIEQRIEQIVEKAAA